MGSSNKIMPRCVFHHCVQPCNPGELTEKRNCNEQPCPVDCVQGPWSDWSPCDAKCGSGTQQRYRLTLVPASNGGKVGYMYSGYSATALELVLSVSLVGPEKRSSPA